MNLWLDGMKVFNLNFNWGHGERRSHDQKFFKLTLHSGDSFNCMSYSTFLSQRKNIWKRTPSICGVDESISISIDIELSPVGVLTISPWMCQSKLKFNRCPQSPHRNVSIIPLLSDNRKRFSKLWHHNGSPRHINECAHYDFMNC